MVKIKSIISYDGTSFSGFQIQPNKRTVQAELEKALSKIHRGESIRVYSSGRTDTGVHANGQTFHFETEYNLPNKNWKNALNTLLPNDIYVIQTEEVDSSFHARYDVKEKEYRYFIWNHEEPDVFKRNYAYHFPYPLDILAMQEACQHLIGTHDFTTFSSAKSTVKGSKIRTIFEATCEQRGYEIEFAFRGSGFLYNMVRIIIGTLLEVGQGKRSPTDVTKLLIEKNRQLAGKTAPSEGLYLWSVKY